MLVSRVRVGHGWTGEVSLLEATDSGNGFGDLTVL